MPLKTTVSPDPVSPAEDSSAPAAQAVKPVTANVPITVVAINFLINVFFIIHTPF
jgi:hypothetical protein